MLKSKASVFLVIFLIIGFPASSLLATKGNESFVDQDMVNKNFNISSLVYDLNSTPFNTSYADWTAKWWQWLISIPQESNPGIDATGEKFDVNQNDPHVVFLVGTFGGSAERNYTIPAGKSVLFPIINFTTS